jgi:hypothetical protein
MVDVARPPAWVGVPSERVALGVGETSPRVTVVATRPAGEEGLKTVGGRWPVETVMELLGSKDLAS